MSEAEDKSRDAAWAAELERRLREFPPPPIEMGSLEGRERWYKTTHHIDELKSLAYNLTHGDTPHNGFRPGVAATGFKLWYDRDNDYHRLSFDLDGCHYEARLYKVWAVTKNGIRNYSWEKNFGFHRMWVEDFFLGKNEAGERGKKHLEWKVPASQEEADAMAAEEHRKWKEKYDAEQKAKAGA